MGTSENDQLPSDREGYFPNLKEGGYRVTSPEAETYNCFAWAAGRTAEWWSPAEGYFWPQGLPRQETVDAYVHLYGFLGYVRCDTSEQETGFEKIAIYVDPDGIPIHAARQVWPEGWTSKLGTWQDIRHTDLHALEGDGWAYGRAVIFLKRPIQAEKF